jgi:hypothetical protein
MTFIINEFYDSVVADKDKPIYLVVEDMYKNLSEYNKELLRQIVLTKDPINFFKKLVAKELDSLNYDELKDLNDLLQNTTNGNKSSFVNISFWAGLLERPNISYEDYLNIAINMIAAKISN